VPFRTSDDFVGAIRAVLGPRSNPSDFAPLFQALRIAVNDELSALDALLQSLPECLAPGGRVAIVTFHSGEDRRVKKAFQAGRRAGVYSDVARQVIRSSKKETFANRRAAAAKLRWAVRAWVR
jgi:16S rRNA (cytosine1402-N4)-methyltransferase